jgi:hypothetical protein
MLHNLPPQKLLVYAVPSASTIEDRSMFQRAHAPATSYCPGEVLQSLATRKLQISVKPVQRLQLCCTKCHHTRSLHTVPNAQSLDKIQKHVKIYTAGYTACH